MPSGSRCAPLLFISILLTGCAANDLVVKRQAESEARIEFLVQASKKGEQRGNELAAQLQSQDERFQALAAEIKQLKDDNRELRASRDELAAQVANLDRQSRIPKVEVVNQAPPVKGGKESGPPQEYVKAFGLYSANNFAAAISGFEAFLAGSPQSDYVPNALYWIGECHYSLAEYAKALDSFKNAAASYPKSPKAPDALLKLGITLTVMKEKEKASAVFEQIISTYPSSPAAARARERLNAR